MDCASASMSPSWLSAGAVQHAMARNSQLALPLCTASGWMLAKLGRCLQPGFSCQSMISQDDRQRHVRRPDWADACSLDSNSVSLPIV